MSGVRRAAQPSGKKRQVLDFQVLRQPDDVTCGPTCLHAVYRYWGERVTLEEVVRSVHVFGEQDGRGTLAVNLGNHALERGYRATLYTFNLQMFDPTWFAGAKAGRGKLLQRKLEAQAEAKAVTGETKFQLATEAYIRFLSLGGSIRFEDLTSRLISGHIRAGRPVLTGLSATYLYRTAREYGPNDDPDDVRGYPAGHFVVLHGYDARRRSLHVADPLEDNPAFASRNYTVSMARLVPAIMLGVLTFDANLLVIEPKEHRAKMDHAS